MYLRVTAFKSDPAKLDAGVAYLRDKILPAMKKAPGFLGATCIIDREKGTGASSTLWESLEAMNKAEQLGNQSRIDAEEAVAGMAVVDVDRFEITHVEMATPNAQLPSYTRVTMAYGDPSKADQIRNAVSNDIVPLLKKQPGFRAFAAGINRMTGRGFTTSSWATPEQREASNAVVAASRQRVSSNETLYAVEVANFETVLADIKVPTTA